jgi:tyrosine-protein kinase Etk/Wzc
MKRSEDIMTNNVSRMLKDLGKYWYVIAIFLAITLLTAVLYLKYAAPTHRITSSVLLRLENANVGRGGGNDLMRAFDIIMHDKTLQNEVYFMQSLPLIREVVGEMDIRTYYYSKESIVPRNMSFTYKNLYRSTPFWIIPTENHVQPVGINFHIRIIDEETFQISASGEAAIMNFSNERIVARDREFKLNGTYRFGSVVGNDMASFTVILNSSYNPEVHEDKDFFFRFNNLDWLASSFKGSLSVETRSIESSLAELTVKAENQELGLDFLTALIDKYIEANMEEANFLANNTIAHIERQLANVSNELASSEEQLQNLRANQSVMNVDARAQNLDERLVNSRVQREEVQRRLNNLEQLNEYFVQYKDSARMLAPSALGLNDPLLNNMIQELTSLNTEKQRIISQDQLRNPRLLTIDATIENLKTAIAENINFSISSTRRELSDLNSQISSLNREYSSLPATQRELLGIERRFNLNDALYTSLLERRIHAQIIKASKLPDIKLIEPPRAIGIASPNRIIVLFFAFFLGTVMPSSVILGIKLVKNRIGNKEDVKFLSQLPIIGSIPVNEYDYQNVVRELPRSPMAEAFHILRTNLVYSLKGENNKVILVTSSIPGEGKSFSAINLATSFAQTNSKTVLVEFDLRNPNKFVNETFNTKDLVGISSYLINKASLDEIIVPTEVSNLDIMLAGQIPPNPIELISTEKTRELFRELRKKYDFIIVDTPPYSLVTDAFLLMNLADIKLYVTRIGYTRKKDLSMNMEDIDEKNIRDIHLVINGSLELNSKYGKYAYSEKSDKPGGNLLTRKLGQSGKKIAIY